MKPLSIYTNILAMENAVKNYSVSIFGHTKFGCTHGHGMYILSSVLNIR